MDQNEESSEDKLPYIILNTDSALPYDLSYSSVFKFVMFFLFVFVLSEQVSRIIHVRKTSNYTKKKFSTSF